MSVFIENSFAAVLFCSLPRFGRAAGAGALGRRIYFMATVVRNLAFSSASLSVLVFGFLGPFRCLGNEHTLLFLTQSSRPVAEPAHGKDHKEIGGRGEDAQP